MRVLFSPSWSFHDKFQVTGAVHHCDREGERGNETNANSAHQSPRDNDGSILTVFSQVYRSVDTSIHVVWCDEASQERDAVGPAALVEKRCPHKF
jgi:hypothetical protein